MASNLNTTRELKHELRGQLTRIQSILDLISDESDERQRYQMKQDLEQSIENLKVFWNKLKVNY